MRKLVTIDNLPVTKNEVVKALVKQLGISALWFVGATVALKFAQGFAVGYMHEAKVILKEKGL